MKRFWLAILLLGALGIARADSGGDEDGAGPFYLPPRDPRAGDLLPESVELLQSLHTLPEQVDLWPRGEERSKDTESLAHPRREVVLVPVQDVASSMERAEALVGAGRFEDAACAYARAGRDGEAAAHAAVMGAVCELRRGDTEGAVDCLGRAASRRDDTQDWQSWAENIHALTSAIEHMEVER